MFKNTLKNGFQKKKQNFLPFEEMVDNGIYAFTYNPIDQPRLEDPLGISDWYSSMKYLFQKLKYARVYLYTEVSKTGRWHFHGFIIIKNRLKFQVFDIQNLMPYGTSCIKVIPTTDDYANWLAYCHKQQNEMNDLLTEQLYCTIDPKILKERNPDGVLAIAT